MLSCKNVVKSIALLRESAWSARTRIRLAVFNQLTQGSLEDDRRILFCAPTGGHRAPHASEAVREGPAYHSVATFTVEFLGVARDRAVSRCPIDQNGLHRVGRVEEPQSDYKPRQYGGVFVFSTVKHAVFTIYLQG